MLHPTDECDFECCEADGRLREMLERLEAELPENSRTVWARIRGETVEFDRDLTNLIGFVAPDDCVAVGIVGVGRAHHYEPRQGGAGRGSGKSTHVPPGGMACRTLCLMERSGRMVGWTRFEDGTSIADPPEAGRLVDTLRRVFCLPTTPPEVPAVEFVGRLWLANILTTAEDDGAHLGWKHVRQLHPSAEAVRAIGVPLTGPTLDRARSVAATAWTWSRLRLQAMEGDWLAKLVSSELASWMDEGMFSRWVLDSTLGTPELLEMLTPWLAPPVLAQLAHALRHEA